MNPVVSHNELPTWNFPRSWSQAKALAREAVEPRVRGDEVTLDGKPGSWLKDMIAVAQFAGAGLLYKRSGEKAQKANAEQPPLEGAAKVKLQDPLLIVPGWNTEPNKFDHLLDHLLSSGDNGERALYLKNGQAYSDQACTEPAVPQASDKLFVALFESNLDAPEVSAPQLEQAVALVKNSVSEKVDVLGYSMGGLATRKMLDDGSVCVDQVALLGTANRGTRFATLAEYIIERDIGWAMSLGGINAAHLPAMGWLKGWDAERPESNPQLDALNRGLERQLSRANEFVSIASDGFSTLDSRWGWGSGGDGLVTAQSTRLDGLASITLSGKANKHHGNLPHDKDVFATLTDYFGWQPVSEVASAVAEPRVSVAPLAPAGV